MDTLFGLVALIVVVWLLVGRTNLTRRPKSKLRVLTDGAGTSRFRDEIQFAVARDYGAAAQVAELRQVKRNSPKDHVPASPRGSGVQAWSPRTQQFEVAGEWYRSQNLRALFSRHARISESGDELRLPAVLVPDPSNPYDRFAVAVFVDHLHVGYMERSDARIYHQAIAAVPGGELVVPSRQWLRGTAQETWARVTSSLPKPEHLACPNQIDENCFTLPPGGTVQVTREEQYLEHLASLLSTYGSEVVVAASLRSVIEERPRSRVELVAVDIEGGQVGVLSPAQTPNFLPLVRRAEAMGRGLICRASMRGNALKADVALHARKAHEFDDAELAALFGPS